MDRDVAQHVAVVAMRASSDIADLVPFLKMHCSEEEYKNMSLAIASASYAIREDVLNKVFAIFPDLEREFDDRISKYGIAI